MAQIKSKLSAYFARVLAALGTKEHWIEVAKRSAVTFGSVFAATITANDSGLSSISGTKVLALSAAAAAFNVVYRTVVIPEVTKVKTQVVPVVLNDPTAPKSPAPPA